MLKVMGLLFLNIGEIQRLGKDRKLNSFSICPTIVQSRFPPPARERQDELSFFLVESVVQRQSLATEIKTFQS